MTTESAADVRAELARRQLPTYRLASKVGLHLSHLGQVIGGRRPLSLDLARRIWRALADETRVSLAHNDSGRLTDATVA